MFGENPGNLSVRFATVALELDNIRLGRFDSNRLSEIARCQLLLDDFCLIIRQLVKQSRSDSCRLRNNFPDDLWSNCELIRKTMGMDWESAGFAEPHEVIEPLLQAITPLARTLQAVVLDPVNPPAEEELCALRDFCVQLSKTCSASADSIRAYRLVA